MPIDFDIFASLTIFTTLLSSLAAICVYDIIMWHLLNSSRYIHPLTCDKVKKKINTNLARLCFHCIHYFFFFRFGQVYVCACVCDRKFRDEDVKILNKCPGCIFLTRGWHMSVCHTSFIERWLVRGVKTVVCVDKHKKHCLVNMCIDAHRVSFILNITYNVVIS